MSEAVFSHLHAVILAGGSGTRLWPLSHREMPKQFLPIGGVASLLRLTAERLRESVPPERIWMVGGENHARTALPHLPGVPAAQILVEPEAKNTAPAIALAALRLAAKDPEAVMAVLPADHFIPASQSGEFCSLLRSAARLAVDKEGLVTLGIRPRDPATGYGYIQAGEASQVEGRACFKAVRFREKPDLETARRYLESGDYFWNSGIFVWKASVFLRKLTAASPKLGGAFRELAAHAGAADFSQRLARTFSQVEGISVDYALMEKADGVWVIPADIGWDDVGSLESFAGLLPGDSEENHSQSELFAVDARRNLVMADKPVALIGVQDLIVVETERALLVVPRERAQEVKDMVSLLKKRRREDLT